jgi:hypothetical protein
VPRGIQGLKIRMANALNRLLGRRGHVFSDRYHLVVLRTPQQTRYCLAYVLLNARKHAHQSGMKLKRALIDPCSSGAHFKGWSEPIELAADIAPAILPGPKTWLLQEGWEIHGRISPREIPKG